jgi:ABC-2 type transport system permease protein
MRKVIVVAVREYLASVRTKAFVISVVIMPILMGGSVIVQKLLEGFRDTSEKRFAVIDRSPKARLVRALQQAIDDYNKYRGNDNPPFKLDPTSAYTPETDAALDDLRASLSDDVRTGKLFGFLEIGPDVYKPWPEAEISVSDTNGGEREKDAPVHYLSNRPTHRIFPELARQALTRAVQDERAREKGLSEKMGEIREIMERVPVASKGLYQRDPATGEVKPATTESRFAPVFVPIGFMLLMFMVIMMSATPLMQGVVEEKMQRIAEVLLGSVSPFRLMLGKLAGMTGVSLTVTAVYLAGAYWAAEHYKVTEYIPFSLLAWFLVYQALAALMYGSLFSAIGAACTDMKETQNLLWPVMLLATMPMFVLGSILQEPNSSVATALSFFPFATPTLMIARLAVPPGIGNWWQPALGVVVVLLTTLVCVYVAGRIFRVGLLLQGKGARLGDIVKWVVRG